MLKSVLDYANELEKTANSTQSFLKELQKGRRKLAKEITDAKAKVTLAKNPDKLVTALLPQIKQDILNSAVDITQGSILEAIRDRFEYDWPEYRRALYLAAADKDSYKVYELGGTGWNKKLTFIIDFNKSAGQLEAWARGVTLTRKDLETKIPRKGGGERQKEKRRLSALQASRAWAGIFGSRNANTKNKYSSTIKSRLSYSGRVAPFWQLLDKGIVPMASDRGGYATPKGKPTNFIQNAQEVMERYTKTILKQYKDQYDTIINEYYKYEDEFEAALSRMDSLINKIELDQAVVNKVRQEYAKDSKYIDDTRLEKAVLEVLQGNLTSGRVEVTAKGSKKRIRPSISKIARIAGVLY